MMEKERIDLRDLIKMIDQQKKLNANLTLEFDCFIETDDITPLVKVINYAINYVRQISQQPLQISLSVGMRGISISLSASTDVMDFPPINSKVNDALQPYDAQIEDNGEPGKFVQLLISFKKRISYS